MKYIFCFSLLHNQDQQRRKRHWQIKIGGRKRKCTRKRMMLLRKRGKSLKNQNPNLNYRSQQRQFPRNKSKQKEATENVAVDVATPKVVAEAT
jgi:hypothetical protein